MVKNILTNFNANLINLKVYANYTILLIMKDRPDLSDQAKEIIECMNASLTNVLLINFKH